MNIHEQDKTLEIIKHQQRLATDTQAQATQSQHGDI